MSATLTTTSGQKVKLTEDWAIGILSRLKTSNAIVRSQRKTLDDNLKATEQLILAQPDNEVLKTLYLTMLKNDGADATVATWVEPVERDGKVKMVTEHCVRRVNTDEFRVSVVRGGTKVRVHMTEAFAAELESRLTGKQDLKLWR